MKIIFSLDSFLKWNKITGMISVLPILLYNCFLPRSLPCPTKDSASRCQEILLLAYNHGVKETVPKKSKNKTNSSKMYLNGTIEGPWLSSRGSCGWYLRLRCLAGCVLPQFPVIIIIWKFHVTLLFSFQREFRSTHQNTNVYDPGNGLPLEATRDLLAGLVNSWLSICF